MNKGFAGAKNLSGTQKSTRHLNSSADLSLDSNSPVNEFLNLQQTVGNQAVQRLFDDGRIQPKLSMGQPGDKYELEADRISEQVMRMPDLVSPVNREGGSVQRQVDDEEKKKEEEELIQPKHISDQITPLVQTQVEDTEKKKREEEMFQAKEDSGGLDATAEIESSINSLRGGGDPLSEAARSYFEPRFGYDFSGVRIHTGGVANEAARSINAHAFTFGNDVIFGSNSYSPNTEEGKKLLAHELVHTIQQKNNSDTVPFIHRYPWGALNEWAIYKGKKLAEEAAVKTASSTSTIIAANPALEAAKKKVKELRNDTAKGKDPNKSEREEIEKETGVILDANPYVGISDIDVEAVWEASASGYQPPWVLLALWAKEGSTKTRTSGMTVSASSESNAQTIVRSYIYYVDLGADHFIHYTAVKGSDNITNFTDADVPAHDTAFKNATNDLVTKKFLVSDPFDQIKNELKVKKNPDGTYTVKPTKKFYVYSLGLVDAFFSFLQFEKTYKELGNKVPSKAMTYVKWNIRSFGDFLKSAESHRKEPEYSKGTGKVPSVEEWSLEKTPKETEWKQVRVNAIRLKFYLIAYKKIFSAGIPEGLMG